MKKIFIIIIIIEIILLTISIIGNIYMYNKYSKFLRSIDKILLEESSMDGKFNISITHKGISLSNKKQIIKVQIKSKVDNANFINFYLHIKNNMKIVDKSNFKIEWREDSIKLTIKDVEGEEKIYIIPLLRD